MILSAQYADQAANAQSLVVIFIDADSMTVAPQSDQRVVDWIAAGHAIGAYVPPDLTPSPAQARYAAFKADANYQTMLAQLKSATPAQVQTYITTNVTDLPSARAMLIKLALVLALVANGS